MTTILKMATGRNKVSTLRWIQGLSIASIFSVVYLLTPTYMLTAIVALCFQYPSRNMAFLYAAPIFISTFMTKCRPMLGLADYMRSMLDYFDYEEVMEISNEEILHLTNTKQKKFILAMQPHGVISFVSLCSWINAPPSIRCVKTAVASVLLKTPILKNVMGIYGLTEASSKNVCHILQNGVGMAGCIVLYIGGIAELFKTSRKEERLYLLNRKGFIKIALREENVDVIPIYLFGNTSVLSVLKTGFLATMSRKMQMSVTYFWGKWGLPLPRDEKLLYVRGKALGMPHIPNPTDEDINKWHAKYCEEVRRIFEENKEKLPAYKHKTLIID